MSDISTFQVRKNKKVISYIEIRDNSFPMYSNTKVPKKLKK